MQNNKNDENNFEILNQFRPERTEILKALHSLQNANPQHYISSDAMKAVAKYFNITLGQVYGIVTYYSMFSTKPRGKYIIRLCKSPVCYMKGSFNLKNYLEEHLQLTASTENISADGLFTIETTECLGHCEQAPAMMVNNTIYSNLTREKIDEILHALKTNNYEL
ncbi:MAG: NAD(P)H-dependent oxidoreductase subunit E [Bacteroidales bacterium]|nr:NAD(P)H-dependent oxidoreductase subunit E [Bacteroidales bacterium]